jgi:Flp pilus assembly protein TadD
MRRFVERGEPGDHTRLDLARVLRLAGSFGEAETELRLLIARNPADLASHRELALLFERSGNLEGAVSELVILRNLAPEDDASRVRLVALLERLGRSEEAERYR